MKRGESVPGRGTEKWRPVYSAVLVTWLVVLLLLVGFSTYFAG